MLAALAVDIELKIQVSWLRDSVRAHYRAPTKHRIRLARLPETALLLAVRRDVERHRVAADVLQRILAFHTGCLLSDDDAQLHFVIDLAFHHSQRDTVAGACQRSIRLEEQPERQRVCHRRLVLSCAVIHWRADDLARVRNRTEQRQRVDGQRSGASREFPAASGYLLQIPDQHVARGKWISMRRDDVECLSDVTNVARALDDAE